MLTLCVENIDVMEYYIIKTLDPKEDQTAREKISSFSAERK